MFTKKFTNFAVILLLSVFVFGCSSDDSTTEELTLTLEASTKNILLGEDVSFVVLDNKGKAITDATILVDNKAIVGYTYKAPAAAIYQVVATKQNYQSSAPISITVAEETLTIKANKEVAKVNDTITFSALNSEQKDITTKVIFYVNAKPIEGNTYTVKVTDVPHLKVYAARTNIKSNEIAIQIEQEQHDLAQLIRGKWKLENAASHDIIYNFYADDTFNFVYFGTLMQGEYRILGDKVHLDVISSGMKMTDYSIIEVKKYISTNELNVLLTVSGIHEQGQAGRLIRQKEDVTLDVQQMIGTWKAELNGQKVFTITFNDNGSCSVIQAENATGIANMETVQYMSKYEKYSANTLILENRNGAYTYYLTVEEFLHANEIKATLFEYVLFPQKSSALILKKM
ncbi:hypothetical protein M2306_000325 [Myroides gitamensis]|uniref:Uncharacterized protein n=1 Tax=Myroides odoratus TaxID=256 RepID=A0A378RMA6_MYROD|nr:hypothetical protein [Myroides odoratus]MCS4239072.1 hypothetical protein [Myroides odoratus]MDH6599631.1 hypothetical protein [Myroides gitamensis]QQU04383.1 hypothetical protein I6I89_03610 [Myroides odoratus]STZ28193.1 Uncharacterised protein [Myroides odoratus]